MGTNEKWPRGFPALLTYYLHRWEISDARPSEHDQGQSIRTGRKDGDISLASYGGQARVNNSVSRRDNLVISYFALEESRV